MADFEIKITGLKEAQKALYSYSQQLGDKVVISALTAGARVIANQAKANAPIKTGRLRRAISVRRSKIFNGRRDSGIIGVYVSIKRGKKRDDPRGAYYGHIVEGGFNTKGTGSISSSLKRAFFTVRSGRKTNRGKTDVPGKKFMERAINAQRRNAIEVATRAVIIGADIVARKVGLK